MFSVSVLVFGLLPIPLPGDVLHHSLQRTANVVNPQPVAVQPLTVQAAPATNFVQQSQQPLQQVLPQQQIPQQQTLIMPPAAVNNIQTAVPITEQAATPLTGPDPPTPAAPVAISSTNASTNASPNRTSTPTISENTSKVLPNPSGTSTPKMKILSKPASATKFATSMATQIPTNSQQQQSHDNTDRNNILIIGVTCAGIILLAITAILGSKFVANKKKKLADSEWTDHKTFSAQEFRITNPSEITSNSIYNYSSTLKSDSHIYDSSWNVDYATTVADTEPRSSRDLSYVGDFN